MPYSVHVYNKLEMQVKSIIVQRLLSLVMALASSEALTHFCNQISKHVPWPLLP